MAVMVSSDTVHKIELLAAVEIRARQSTSCAPLILASVAVTNAGWTINPTHKSDRARLKRSTKDGRCKEEVLQIETRTRRFPNAAATDVGMLKMQFKTGTAVPCVSNQILGK